MIARNPDADSTLPYVLRVPLGDGVVLKSRGMWPRTAKVYCHRLEEWPADAEIVERVGTRSCVRRGAAIDLALDRGRENRSQFVMTTVRGGRQVIFWQSARTNKKARPRVTTPTACASGVVALEIVIDSRERYGYTFSDRHATTTRARLDAGDYGLVSLGTLLASVECKSLDDLVSSLTTGKLGYQLAELASLPRAAVVVESATPPSSVRPASWRRSGPTASSLRPPWRTTNVLLPGSPPTSLPHHPWPRRRRRRPRCGHGLSCRGTTSPIAVASRPGSSRRTSTRATADAVQSVTTTSAVLLVALTSRAWGSSV